MISKIRIGFLILFFLPFYCEYIYAFSCSVTRIIDGDTFHCLPEKSPYGAKVHKDGTISVRMRGIDAPEKRQAFGEDVRLSLKDMIGGKTVKLDVKDIDCYSRVVAYVWLGNININLEQVKDFTTVKGVKICQKK